MKEEEEYSLKNYFMLLLQHHFIFIGGFHFSGTSVTTVLLGNHPEISPQLTQRYGGYAPKDKVNYQFMKKQKQNKTKTQLSLIIFFQAGFYAGEGFKLQSLYSIPSFKQYCNPRLEGVCCKICYGYCKNETHDENHELVTVKKKR